MTRFGIRCLEAGFLGGSVLAAGVLTILLVSPARGQPVPGLAALRSDFAAGRYAEVHKAVKNAVGRTTDVDILLLGAEAALNLGYWIEADSLGAEAARVAPGDPRGYAMQGHAHWGRARFSDPGPFTSLTYLDAGIFYGEARQRGGDTFEMGYFEAEAYREGGDLGKALMAIEAAVGARPDHLEAGLLKASILLAAGKGERAVGLLVALRKKEPQAAAVAQQLMQAVIASGNRQRCREVFLDLVKSFPEDLGIYTAFATHFGKDDPPTFLEEAMEATRRIHSPEVDRYPLWYLGMLALRDGRFAKALELFTVYRDQVPADGEGHLAVGKALVALGRLPEARTELLKAHSYGGVERHALVAALEQLVSAWAAANEYAAAAEVQQVVQALALRPIDDLNLGTLLYNAGQREEGLRILQGLSDRAEELDLETRATAENYLGLFLAGLGRREAAEAAFRRSIAADDELTLDASENLGVLLADEGRHEEAAKLLTRVLERDRTRHRSRYHLMRVQYPDLVEVLR